MCESVWDNDKQTVKWEQISDHISSLQWSLASDPPRSLQTGARGELLTVNKPGNWRDVAWQEATWQCGAGHGTAVAGMMLMAGTLELMWSDAAIGGQWAALAAWRQHGHHIFGDKLSQRSQEPGAQQYFALFTLLHFSMNTKYRSTQMTRTQKLSWSSYPTVSPADQAAKAAVVD